MAKRLKTAKELFDDLREAKYAKGAKKLATKKHIARKGNLVKAAAGGKVGKAGKLAKTGRKIKRTVQTAAGSKTGQKVVSGTGKALGKVAAGSTKPLAKTASTLGKFGIKAGKVAGAAAGVGTALSVASLLNDLRKKAEDKNPNNKRKKQYSERK